MLRIKHEWTQEEAARRLDVAPSTLSKWENGKSYPDVVDIGKLEKLYGVEYCDIIFLPNQHG